MGCDKRTLLVDGTRSNFNPRTHVGCDPGAPEPPEPPGLISIHAPTWGATMTGKCTYSQYTNFNPRTHVGCDCCGPLFFSQLSQFQSTHPRGVRLKHNIMPRSEEISIHAPTWGATHRPVTSAVVLPLFQSTHPRGVRLRLRVGLQPPEVISIHAPTWGATK